jgi:hypothetical protein
MRRKREHREKFTGIAPEQIIREDFYRLNGAETLRTTENVEELILMQSVEGHAHEGGGMFHGRRFANTSMEDIASALRRDPEEVAAERQALISDVFQWAERALSGDAAGFLANSKGEPLLGMGMFRDKAVCAQDVLRGLYLGGKRDTAEVRRAVEGAYGLRMGFGNSFMVDEAVMHRLGLDGDVLAHGDHEDEIGNWRSQGLIVDDAVSKPNRPLRYMYIRYRRGPGASDDAAILAGGFLYNADVALGVFLADAIDTLEKFVLDYSDKDSDLAAMIKERFPQLSISDREVLRLTALCAIPEEMEGKVPDSSLRHMLRVDRQVDQTALEAHLQFIQGKPVAPMHLAMEAVHSPEFYDWFRQRFEEFRER